MVYIKPKEGGKKYHHLTLSNVRRYFETSSPEFIQFLVGNNEIPVIMEVLTLLSRCLSVGLNQGVAKREVLGTAQGRGVVSVGGGGPVWGDRGAGRDTQLPPSSSFPPSF